MNTIERLWTQMGRIEQFIEAQDFDAALKLLTQVEAQAARAGIDSPHLMWLRAIVEDHRGEYETALVSINTAIAMDPLGPPFRQSHRVITTHIKEALTGRRVEPSRVPALWALLAQGGEADDGVHLALVRHHMATGAHEAALKLLKAVTTLSPANTEAWGLLLLVATKLDDCETAAEARLRAMATGPTAAVMAEA